ncbi:hypothetical protein KM043_007391 [Ampulex compressa]|nr:hypothetical protein KM043_007391 [Ampulex compressa]
MPCDLREIKVALESYKQSLTTSSAQSASREPKGGVVYFDNCSTLIEVTVKAKERKRTSAMVSNSPIGQRAMEGKKRPLSGSDTHQNWGRILREQNRPVMKQGLKQLISQTQLSKSVKPKTDSKEARRIMEMQKHEKHEIEHIGNHLDEIPVKQVSLQKKTEERTSVTSRAGNPSSTSVASTMESILVLDRAVQCGGIFEHSDDRFGVFNPVRTLGFLMKELEDLVKDEKSSKILTDMEQVLLRIPTEFGKLSTGQDLEAIALRTKLEASTIQLEETSKKMNAVCEALRKERDSLRRQVQKQVTLLNEARDNQLDLENTIKTLTQELQDAIKTVESKEETIVGLKEEVKSQQYSQKVIADLKANLNEQMELARQRYLEMQYLTLEKDKLAVLSSYKDTLLTDLRNAVKDLQNHIADQLVGLKDAYANEEFSNGQISVVRGGIACSSPTSTSSPDSNIPVSWRDISDVSVPHNLQVNSAAQKHDSRGSRTLQFAKQSQEDREKKKAKYTKDAKTKDSGHLEFISLPGGESSHTLFAGFHKDRGYTESSQSAIKDKEDTNRRETKDTTSGSAELAKVQSAELLHRSAEKYGEKGRQGVNPSKRKEASEAERQAHGEERLPDREDTRAALKADLPNNLIDSNITEQFQNMFQDIRLQSRIPVNVPSPPRDYPHPDWSDSTLPSISAASEFIVLQSNDT